MSRTVWQRHGSEAVAVDELLDAAGRAFAELGVAKATMIDVCRYAGCSRATLYRYFPNQAALHHAFVNRAALQIAARMAQARDTGGGPKTMADRIIGGIQAVRSDPLLAVWFRPENVSVPMALSQDSELLAHMGAAFVGELSSATSTREAERRGGWLLRCIVALLAMPAADEVAERHMIEAFVLPVLIDDLTPRRASA
ncbi:MAG: TetR/AcrR family transcriptional regulator [Acidimicrobiales bacterium]